ncbi:MAG TPA: M1 family aminopeptidase [Bacteroidales bacterium]|nr:M1 family aminopeptidase [Bacteroidales bacterium]
MKQYLHLLTLRIILCLIIGAGTISALFAQGNRTNWYGDYDVTHYLIDVKVNDTSKYISGHTTITSKITATALDSFYCELISELTVDSVFAGNAKSQFTRNKGIVKIKLDRSYAAGDKLSVTIFYKGVAPKSSFLSSFSQRRDETWNIPVTWTLSEPFGASQWFACKQYLPDKADSAQINITVPANRKAGSNGLLVRTIPVGNNQVRYEWKTNYPTAYYLLSFTVADYQEYNFYARVNAQDSVLVQNYIYNRPDYLKNNKEDIDRTADFIHFYSRVFGDYPFKKEKYGHCVGPIGGGMEHQTMTTLQNFGYNLVSHELAHQWFGDYVTCENWQDIWLNEGFASYAEYLALDSLESHVAAIAWMNEAHSYAFLSNGSVYIPLSDAGDESRIFSYYTTYKKGAAIIHALRYEMNDDPLFFSILRTYLTRFAFRSATAKDFIDVVNELSGADYNCFFEQWYYRKGYPVYDVSWSQSGDSVFLASVQSPIIPEAGFFKMHYDLRFVFSNGDTTIRVLQDAAKKTFSFKFGKTITDIKVNPERNALMKGGNATQVTDLPSFDTFLNVQPNPFREEFKIQFTAEPVSDAIIKIVGLDGREIKSIKGRKRREIRVDSEEWNSGVYVLYVLCDGKKYVRKLIKTRF